MDRVVEWETWELEVNAEEDPTGGSVPDGPDMEFGDGWAGKGLSWLDEGRKELEDGEARLVSHGFCFGGFDNESGSVHVAPVSGFYSARINYSD